jgi:hypothetical protein
VIERFLSLPCGRNKNGEVLLDLILPDQVSKFLRTQSIIHTVVGLGFRVERSRFWHVMIIANKKGDVSCEKNQA